MTPNERQLLIGKIRSLPNQVTALVQGLSEYQLTAHPLRGEWSVAQNVHHLADSHMNSYIRCKLIATEARPPLKPYNQDAWALFADAASPDIAESLALLRALHNRWASFWEHLPVDAWQRSGLHPESGELTLETMLRSYAAHGEAHLDQIRRTLTAQE
jgi:hypothetical protein